MRNVRWVDAGGGRPSCWLGDRQLQPAGRQVYFKLPPASGNSWPGLPVRDCTRKLADSVRLARGEADIAIRRSVPGLRAHRSGPSGHESLTLAPSSPRCHTTDHAVCCFRHPPSDGDNQKLDSYLVVEPLVTLLGCLKAVQSNPLLWCCAVESDCRTIAAKTASTTDHWAISSRTLQLAPQLWRT